MSRNVSDLHPRLQEKIQELQRACKAQGLIIGISECLRTVAEQDLLYAKGRTAPGSIVTNAKGNSYSSQHQWGIAADFYRNDGKGTYNEEGKFFEQVGAIAKSIGLGWGGDWSKPVDKPHLYLPDWGKTPTALKSKYGTPNVFFKTWGKAPNPSLVPQTPSQSAPASYTKKQFIMDVQRSIGANQDGIAGKETLSKTVTVSALKNRKHAVVKPLQQYLIAIGYPVGNPDGIAGSKFTAGVKAFQRANGCVQDGEITSQKKTWQKFLGL